MVGGDGGCVKEHPFKLHEHMEQPSPLPPLGTKLAMPTSCYSRRADSAQDLPVWVPFPALLSRLTHMESMF